MDRRMLAIGAALVTMTAVGCGESDDPQDNAAQAAPVQVEVTTAPRAQGTDRRDAAPIEAAYVDQSGRDKTLYFNRSGASQR
jgi:predicted component of type VI protein secretion system